MKKFFVIFCKVFISGLIVLALLEIGLRLFPILIPVRLLVDFQEGLRAEVARRLGLPTIDETVVLDRDDGGPRLRIFKPFAKITLKPSQREFSLGAVPTVMMDQAGFCNPPRNSYDARTIDIIAIGDSFTACNAVKAEDTWASQLSLLLGRSAYNLGRGRTGPYEYLQIFKKFGLQKSPQVVIMNIYEGNDLRDAVHYQLYRQASRGQRSAQLASSPCTSPRTAWCHLCFYLTRGAIGRYSYSYNLAVTAMDSIRYEIARGLSRLSASRDPLDSEANFHYRFIFSGGEVPFNRSNSDTDEVMHARCLRNREINLEIFTEALQTFVKLSQNYRFVPVVSYTPSAHTAYAANVVFDDPNLGDLMPWFSREQRDFFKTKGRELGYVFIDLTSSLQSAARTNGINGLLYFPSNLHLTPRGNTVVAEILARALRDLNIVSNTRRRPDNSRE